MPLRARLCKRGGEVFALIDARHVVLHYLQMECSALGVIFGHGYGTDIAGRPRTDPCERKYRTWLLPRMIRVETHVRKRMQYTRARYHRSKVGRMRVQLGRLR